MKETYWPNVKSAVMRELGDGAVSVAADVERYRLLSLRDIAAHRQWSWLEFVPVSVSTDSGENHITKPGYFGKEFAIYQSGSGREIEYITPEHYARRRSITGTASTKPECYTIIKDRIYFYQPLTAGQSVLMTGTIDHNALTDSNASPLEGVATVMPNDFQQIVEWDILRRLDSDNRKKGEWSSLYWGELNQKAKQDRQVRGRKAKGKQDKVIRASRIYTGV